MNEPPKQRWGCLQWGIVAVLLGALSLYYLYIDAKRTGEQMIAENNCRQIILCLKHYARNADSGYPDGRLPDLKSANQVFREFFKEEIVLDERIFGCRNSVFNPNAVKQ
ncbi:MAG TPA: hypothetical protein DDZ88_16570, partial [Verrucomicrobiales bacterium]|nr:hypothetical protein [Verrucomicrobiales bacterium]